MKKKHEEEDEIAALKKKAEELLAMKMKQLEEDLPKQLVDAIQEEIKDYWEETRMMIDNLSGSIIRPAEAIDDTWKQGLMKEVMSAIEGGLEYDRETRRLVEDLRANLPGNYVYGPHQEIELLPDNYVPTESGKGNLTHNISGLAIYQDIFSVQRIYDLITLLQSKRSDGEKGKLSGHTYLPGPYIPCLQFGVSTLKDITSCVEPIPGKLQAIIDRLALWRFLHQSKLPNTCEIYFYDEEVGSPLADLLERPWVQPLYSLLLSDSRMIFNRRMGGGLLELSLGRGSLLVIPVGDTIDNSIRALMCPSKTKRIIIDFSIVDRDDL